MVFQELFIWLAREHQLSQLIDAPGGSCWLLRALWAPMVPPGGCWRKFMKTICFIQQNVCFSFPRAFPNVSHELYSRSFKIYENHCFVAFWIQGQKIIKSSIPGLVLSASGPHPGQKIIKSSLLGLVFSMSGAKARMSSNRTSWDWFCRLLEPRLESHRIRTSGIDFLDFCGQSQKGIKSGLLKLLFSTSGTNARESSNQDFWD